MEKVKERTELEQAKELVQADMKERTEKCAVEVETALSKYRCNLSIDENGRSTIIAQI